MQRGHAARMSFVDTVLGIKGKNLGVLRLPDQNVIISLPLAKYSPLGLNASAVMGPRCLSLISATLRFLGIVLEVPDRQTAV